MQVAYELQKAACALAEPLWLVKQLQTDMRQ